MTALAWLLPFAAVLVGLSLRARRIHRRHADRDRLLDDLKSQLARADRIADRLHRRLRMAGLQVAAERRRARVAEKHAEQWKAIAHDQFERLITEKEQRKLDAAMGDVDAQLQQLEARP